jgi:tetratricopeptide (TPR) repeat protein
VQGVIKNLGLSYPIYLDAEHRIEEKIGVIVFPSTGIVGPGGELKFYLPSRNSNYRQIIQARLKLQLGLMNEKEFDLQMKQIGEELGSERVRAEDHFKTGLRLSRQGKSKAAVSELKQALSLDPALIDAHLALGYAYLDSEDPTVAQREFELVLKQHTASPGAKLDRGIEILNEAVQINPDPVQGYYELGKAYEKKGNLKEAMHAYKWAVRKLLQGRR